MRHQPCILNYHMLPFTVTPSPFRKCQTSVSKSGGIFEGGKGTQMASGIPQNLFIAERGPRTLYKQFVGGNVCFRNGSLPPLCGEAGQDPRAPEQGAERVCL